MEMKSESSFAVIGDLVGSRRAPSRAAVQRALESALERVNALAPSTQPLAPTIGDEFQAMYQDLQSALLCGLAVRLALPEEMDARIGIGRGANEIVGATDYGLTQDGPAWWSARAAIDEVKRRERRTSGLRTWFWEGGVVNAYVMTRDHLVSGFDGRQRRLLLGLLEGTSQAELAEREAISASAVSQSLRRSGAFAVLDGLELVH